MDYQARQRLRDMLKAQQTIVAPGAHNAIAAKVVEHLGFNCVYIGGWMTGGQLAITEPLTTLTEQADAASWLVRATKLPVIVDADAGFGDVIHTARAVREFEYRGVAGIHIEDQVFPKRAHYHKGVEHVVPREEFRWKLDAALQARQDPNFIIIARTDARSAVDGSLDEAIERGRMAKELGVDVVMPMMHNRGPEEMRAYRDAVPDIPLVHLTGFAGGLSVDECEQLGYRLLLYPLTSIIAEVTAVHEVYVQLKDSGQVDVDRDRQMQTRELIENLIDLPTFYAVEERTTEKVSV